MSQQRRAGGYVYMCHGGNSAGTIPYINNTSNQDKSIINSYVICLCMLSFLPLLRRRPTEDKRKRGRCR